MKWSAVFKNSVLHPDLLPVITGAQNSIAQILKILNRELLDYYRLHRF